ncbi:MAG: beta-ketoacyl-ACP synthase II [Filifactoraceae bacterium]
MKRVVITGIGAISPIGNTASEMWESMKNGICGIDEITKFDTEDFKVKIAAEVKGFKPELYMDKSDIRRNDLYTQYALAAATQAMEDSRLIIDPERLGVYFGSGIGGISSLVTEQKKLMEKGSSRVSPFVIPMMISNIAAGSIAIKFNAQGPCLPVVTACATSTHAIGEAFRSIKHGYADAIIAGGSEASIVPIAFAGFTNCMALTSRNDKENASVPFDMRRDGFVMGEGAGAIILEEYGHAKARGAKIYAEICGYGNTCDAHHITAPHPEAQGAFKAIKSAVDEAGGIKDASSLYINAHGTSTPLNDKTETLAIKMALGKEDAYKCSVSSTKSMTGHLLGAAGVIEAIASIKAIEEGIVPPTIGYKEADPDCDLNITPNKAISREISMAISSSLGFGGHNGVIVFKKL